MRRRVVRKPSSEDHANNALTRVDARFITGAAGERPYPFSPAMFEVGYGLFEPLPKRPELPPLWGLATSDDVGKRHEYLRLLELFEGMNPMDPSIIDLGMTIYDGRKEITERAQLRVSGVRGENTTYDILSGERHVLAIMWLWIKGMIARPVVQAEVVGQEGEGRRP